MGVVLYRRRGVSWWSCHDVVVIKRGWSKCSCPRHMGTTDRQTTCFGSVEGQMASDTRHRMGGTESNEGTRGTKQTQSCSHCCLRRPLRSAHTGGGEGLYSGTGCGVTAMAPGRWEGASGAPYTAAGGGWGSFGTERAHNTGYKLTRQWGQKRGRCCLSQNRGRVCARIWERRREEFKGQRATCVGGNTKGGWFNDGLVD